MKTKRLFIFLLCLCLSLAPPIPSQAKLKVINDHNAIDLENDLQHVNYPSISKYFNARDKVLAKVNPKWPVEEKLFFIHDYILQNTEYDYDFAAVNSEKRENGNQAYGIIIDHKAVCQGYADAFKDLATQLGIPTIRVSNREHTWNAVQVNGKWYYIDCTSDDSLVFIYKMFLRNENGIRQNLSGTFYKDRLVPCDPYFAEVFSYTTGYYLSTIDRPVLDGKFTSSTYEKMSWHNATEPVVYLNNGIGYVINVNDSKGEYIGRDVYYYKCDGSNPIKVTRIPRDLPNGYNWGEPLLSASGDTLSINLSKYTFKYTCNASGVKAVKKTLEDVIKETKTEETKTEENGNYVFLKNGKAYYNSNNNSVYFQKDGSKAKKIVDIMAYTTKVPQDNRWDSSRTDCLSGNGYKLTIKTNAFDLEYNTKTGKLKQVRGHLKTASKFTLKDLTYKVTGSKQVSVASIKGTKVTIPDTISHLGVKYKVVGIEKNAASGGKVKTLTIGKNVKSIGQKAFYQCPITKITVNSTGITSIGKNAFAIKGNKVTAKVPKKKLSKYKKLFMNAGFPKKGTVKY